MLVRPTWLKHRFGSSVSNGSFSIPIVDFSGFREATSLKGRQKVATEIVSAFKDSGFVYLSGHGIPSGLYHVSIECTRKSLKTHQLQSRRRSRRYGGLHRFVIGP